MAEQLVVAGGLLLSGPEWVPREADLLIVDGAVEKVGAAGEFATVPAERLDARGRVVMPGMINAHTHSHALLARGASRNWTLEDSLLNGGWMSAQRSDELARLSAQLTAAELIASGCTGLFDLVAQSQGPSVDGLHATARGYADLGIRALVAPMVSDRTVHEAVPEIGACCTAPVPSGLGASELVDRCRDFIESFPALAGVGPAVAPTILAHCTAELAQGLRDLAQAHDLRIHTHLAESKPQAISGERLFGHSITAELQSQGLLDHRLTAAHAIWLDDSDRRLLADAGVVCVTVPGSNLRLGSGVADTRAMLSSGVTLAVGTDGANSADALDVLDAVRLTSLMSRVWAERPAAQWLTVAETLDAATTGGAAACGWQKVGRLEPGWSADLVLLDGAAFSFLPTTDLANQLITAARAADVTDVVIAGRPVMRERRFVDFDLDAARARFNDLAADFAAATADARSAAHEQVLASADALTALRRRAWHTDNLLHVAQHGDTERGADGCR